MDSGLLNNGPPLPCLNKAQMSILNAARMTIIADTKVGTQYLKPFSYSTLEAQESDSITVQVSEETRESKLPQTSERRLECIGLVLGLGREVTHARPIKVVCFHTYVRRK
jgi:hypothetical protein